MVANTPRGYPYMQGPDVPDLGYATQALAEAIDADMAAFNVDRLIAKHGTVAAVRQALGIQSGSSVVEVAANGTAVIPFGWAFNGTPSITVSVGEQGNPEFGSVVMSSHASANGSGFQVILRNASGIILTSGNFRVNWVAIGTPA